MEFAIVENIGLDNNYEHTIDFPAETIEESKELQRSFFESRIIKRLTDIRWIGTDRVIFDFDINEANNFSYCFYDLTINGVTKRYYAFINEINMTSNKGVELLIQVDEFQTHMFDIELKNSFIERQHEDRFFVDPLNNDYLVPKFSETEENLAYGQYQIKDSFNMNYSKVGGSLSFSEYFYLIKTRIPLESGGSTTLSSFRFSSGNIVNMGCYVYMIPCVNLQLTLNGTDFFNCNVGDILSNLINNENVLSIEIVKYPPVLCKFSLNDINQSVRIYGESSDYSIVDIGNLKYMFRLDLIRSNYAIQSLIGFKNLNSFKKDISRFSKDNSYSTEFEPKLLCFPYSYQKLYCESNELIVRNENLSTNTSVEALQSCELDGCLSVSVKNLKNYSSINETDYEENICDMKPSYLTLFTNAWQSYITNNRAQRTAGFTNMGIQTAGGILAGVLGGTFGLAQGVSMGTNAITQINTQLAKEKDLKNQPPDIRAKSNNIVIDSSRQTIGVIKYEYSLTNEYKNILGSYFNKFGYKCLKNITPNVQSRYYFNYIKIIEANIKGNLSLKKLNTIKEMFNKGVTIWHYRDSETFRFLDYTKENAEVSLIGE